MTIKTNNQYRDLVYGYQLTAKELTDFDYIAADDLQTHAFIKYRGHIYDLSDFMRIESSEKLPPNSSLLHFQNWHGYAGDSYFSGTLVKISKDGEQAILGRYYT